MLLVPWRDYVPGRLLPASPLPNCRRKPQCPLTSVLNEQEKLKFKSAIFTVKARDFDLLKTGGLSN